MLDFIKKTILAYKNSSLTLRATIWYTACNSIQKLVVFLMIPYLTRALGKTDYGVYAVFLSWTEIFEIIATMRIYSNGYVAGMIRYENDQRKYTASIQLLCFSTISLTFGLGILFLPVLSEMIHLQKKFIIYMFLSFYASSSVGIWSAKQRINNKYKMMVFATFLYSIVAPIGSIMAVELQNDKLDAAVATRVILQFCIAIPFFCDNSIGKEKKVCLKYCRESLIYNFPLLPYYLSMVVLNSSDRIMISNLVGEGEAGIYSVAYSLSMMIFVFVGALNLAIQPWLFRKIKQNCIRDTGQFISLATTIVTVLNSFAMLVSPELISIIAPPEYQTAFKIMPPVIFCVFLMFVYQQFLNINFFFEENKIIFFASISGAVINVFLNYIYINKCGFVAAGYTTLICYGYITLVYFFSMRYTAKKNGIRSHDLFDLPFLLTNTFFMFLVMLATNYLYPYPIIRYSIIVISLSIMFLNRKKLLVFCKMIQMDRRI